MYVIRVTESLLTVTGPGVDRVFTWYDPVEWAMAIKDARPIEKDLNSVLMWLEETIGSTFSGNEEPEVELHLSDPMARLMSRSIEVRYAALFAPISRVAHGLPSRMYGMKVIVETTQEETQEDVPEPLVVEVK